ncbi:ETX/MTX2 family pore-forming toxin [Spiroplasma sp. DGKH1]|uniref:ETX/MTX2 family pore-forming toxin n=1 Tax=Spiroplasma sp. DGKH1 TaxID=3050074 RepID=UPI0034C662F0
MKKLLSLFASGIIIGSSCTSSLLETNKFFNLKNNETLPPTTLENLMQDINEKCLRVNPGVYPTESLSDATADLANRFIANKTGIVSVYDFHPINSNVVETFSSSFSNTSDLSQTFKTQSYSKSVTNTISYYIEVGVKISGSFNFSVFWTTTSVDVEVDLSGKYSHTTTTTEKVTAPSQTVTVNPHSNLDVTYIIEQGSYGANGRIKFYLPLDTIFYGSLMSDGYTHGYNIKNLAHILAYEDGYGKYLQEDYNGDSALTVDDIANPKHVSLNLPISWTSQGGAFTISYNETRI